MQSYHRVHVQLGKKDRKQIAGMLNKGRESARVLRRASILRQLDQGQRAAQVADNVGVAPKTVRAIARRCEEEGLEQALYEKPRPRASSGYWTRARASGSSPWCAASPRKAGRAGAFGSSPRKR
jgi:DNA-binding transcriptional ArsR family regulator